MIPTKKLFFTGVTLAVLASNLHAQSLWGGSSATVSPAPGTLAISNTPAVLLQSVPLQTHYCNINLTGLTSTGACSNIVFTVTATQTFTFWPSNSLITNGALNATFNVPQTNINVTVTAAIAATTNITYTIIGQ